LTAQKVEVGIIFQEMLDTATAAAYLAKNRCPSPRPARADGLAAEKAGAR
jgi:hypothetical protein